MSAFRRDKLRRLIEAGRVELAGSYRFDDMYGESRAAAPMPVAMLPDGGWQNRREGICYIRPDELTGYGRAYERPDGTVTLYVHSNSNYTFRILTEPKT